MVICGPQRAETLVMDCPVPSNPAGSSLGYRRPQQTGRVANCGSGIPPAYRRCRSYSDFWHAYEQLLCTGTHQMVGKESGETAPHRALELRPQTTVSPLCSQISILFEIGQVSSPRHQMVHL